MQYKIKKYLKYFIGRRNKFNILDLDMPQPLLDVRAAPQNMPVVACPRHHTHGPRRSRAPSPGAPPRRCRSCAPPRAVRVTVVGCSGHGVPPVRSGSVQAELPRVLAVRFAAGVLVVEHVRTEEEELGAGQGGGKRRDAGGARLGFMGRRLRA